jgi:hypothetical protein
MLYKMKMKTVLIVASLLLVCVSGFTIPQSNKLVAGVGVVGATRTAPRTARLFARPNSDKKGKQISAERRKQLGIPSDSDEYDLDVALANNTDPFISKLIAGSLILVILGLLVVGVIIPSLTDYGEGVCNPLLTGGRC